MPLGHILDSVLVTNQKIIGLDYCSIFVGCMRDDGTVYEEVVDTWRDSEYRCLRPQHSPSQLATTSSHSILATWLGIG